MEYKVNELAKLSGVSTRTLRYYDGIGLLSPERTDPNGYRIYGPRQVDTLQQILLYRELGMRLEDIRELLSAPDYSREHSLEAHLAALQQKKEQIELMIANVSKTIDSMKEGYSMTDKEKFDGFKRKLIEDNEKTYGKEVTEKYGADALINANKKISGMTQEQWRKQDMLNEEIFAQLRAAMAKGDPACEEAQKAADLHRQWLCSFWPEGMYTKEGHLAMAESYLQDERFTAYYDKELGAGGTQFLHDAIEIYTK